jgi:murein L,D-transpeptidase YcbB/YkuD
MVELRTLATAATLVWLIGARGDSPPFASRPAVRQASEIQAIVAGRSGIAGDHLSSFERQQLVDLYGPIAYAPLWTDAAGRIGSDAREALSLLQSAADDGLNPVEYSAEHLHHYSHPLGATQVAPLADIAAFDVSLSLNTLRYLRDLHLGRVDPRTMGYAMPPRERDDFAELLRAAVLGHRLPSAALELSPQIPVYRQLRLGLSRYRALAADPALRSFKPAPATLRPGDRSPDTELLDRFLVALGDLERPTGPEMDPTLYEGPVVEGVKHFQMRHGLDADGVLGKSTRAALSVPLSWRAHQIEMSMERMRWLPHLDRDRLLVVNIPMFRLLAVDHPGPGGVSPFSSAVIVGRALRTRTPVLFEEMEYVIFRPYWNVPVSIVRNEILPAIARAPGYLERHDMEIVAGQSDAAPVVPPTSGNIARLRDGSLRLRQRPGPANSLGLLKFVFPNDSNVYLHDTPAPELFTRARRDFSHGCIRVADPAGLAEWVLAGQPEWSRESIVAAMNATVSRRVMLPRPLQVIIFYLTAAVTLDDGDIQFAEDIYGHDARLDQFLKQRDGS